MNWFLQNLPDMPHISTSRAHCIELLAVQRELLIFLATLYFSVLSFVLKLCMSFYVNVLTDVSIHEKDQYLAYLVLID